MGALRNILIVGAMALFLAPAVAKEKLHTEDIYPTVQKLLKLHVEENELSEDLLARTFKVYFDLFDDQKIYFTQEDLAPYLNPSPELLDETLSEFSMQNYENYTELQKVIVHSVERARKMRQNIYANYENLLAKVDEPLTLKEGYEEYVSSTEQLEARLTDQFVRFLQAQSKLSAISLADHKDRVVALYERRLRSKEDDFLADQGLEGFKTKQDYLEHYQTLYLLKAFAKSLDSHTTYFSPQEAYNMKMQLEKGFRGIGVVLQESLDGIVIRRLVKGGPAEMSGRVEANDRIVSVDGVDIREMPFDRVLELIRGEEGSAVRLGIMRVEERDGGMAKKELEVSLTRRMIVMEDQRVDSVAYPYGDGIIGVVTLYSFYEGANGITSEGDLREAIQGLKAQGNLKGLVLDLRNNSGGFLTQAVKVAGLFMTNGVVAISKYSNGFTRYFRDLDGRADYSGPLVVLTSKASASAAEIVSQTLQDYGRAIVVGDARTYGKGSIQHQTVTRSDAEEFFKVTVGRYYTASGKSTQISGVKADIVVPSIYYNEEIGEEYLDYPLESDRIAAAFQDPLTDINADFRDWFEKYYVPSLEKHSNFWAQYLPQLKANSQKRIENIPEFKQLLGGSIPESLFAEEMQQDNSALDDIQVKEAVEIAKDMAFIYLAAKNAAPVNIAKQK